MPVSISQQHRVNLLTAARDYAQHAPGCDRLDQDLALCSCGLTIFLSQLEDQLKCERKLLKRESSTSSPDEASGAQG